MSAPRLSRARSWLRWLLLALILGAPPALWFASRDFRLVILEWLYPRLEEDGQAWAFKRLREVEERPDVAWRCYASAAEDSAEAWKYVFGECWKNGDFEFRGLEDDLVAVLEDPRYYPAHEQLFGVLIACRVRHPRLPALLRPYLEHRDLKIKAAHALIINGRPKAAMPVLAAALSKPRLIRTQPAQIPGEAVFALDALRDLGPEARPLLETIRPWAALENPFAERHALAALWVIERDPRHLDRLRALFRGEARGDFNQVSNDLALALLLAELGEGDEKVRQVLENWHHDYRELLGDEFQLVKPLGWLGSVGSPSLPLIRPYLQDEDPALRFFAREAIAAIENDRRGSQP